MDESKSNSPKVGPSCSVHPGSQSIIEKGATSRNLWKLVYRSTTIQLITVPYFSRCHPPQVNLTSCAAFICANAFNKRQSMNVFLKKKKGKINLTQYMMSNLYEMPIIAFLVYLIHQHRRLSIPDNLTNLFGHELRMQSYEM